MPMLNIRIARKSQKEPAFPEITDKNFVEKLELYGASILEGGMTSGKTSIGFVVKDAHGGFYMLETSAAIIDGLYHAIKGAEQNWKENPE